MKHVAATPFIKKINNYWIHEHPQPCPRAFWEQSVYHIGNLNACKIVGDQSYFTFSKQWCEKNQWRGHPFDGPKNEWDWQYGEEKDKSVLFADWHACYQVYLMACEEGTNKKTDVLKNIKSVIDYEISKLDDSFWWWADGLFMGMPVMTLLYKQTNDVSYLTKMHEYFLFAMELMYDGKNGIPTHECGYSSSAYFGGPYGGKKAIDSIFSNEKNYQHLFYRDASYAFPAKPLPGDLVNTKNFWSRGNGWVFAALIRVLRDLPKEWAHYHFYLRIFKEMAQAIINCQKTDSEGRGFWTQSLLAHNFSCDKDNPEGYETSGTAFFTFGLLAGINDGFLNPDEFLQPALKSWRYLTEVATHPNGKLGYVQWVGGEAGKSAVYDNTQDFAVGAVLLAACELAILNGEYKI